MPRWSPLLCLAATAALASGDGKAGTVYRFQSATSSGTVWVVGDEARMETDPEEGAATGDRVLLSKAGGKQRLILNTKDRTYYDQVAYLSGKGFSHASPATLNVGAPFSVADVAKIRVDLVPASPPDGASLSDACRPVSLKLSYELKLRLKMADVSIPGRVEGFGEFCLSESIPVPSLPFGHGLEIVSGIPKVDAVLTERLASLKGIPIRRTLTIKRLIEGGQVVSETSTIALSDFRTTEVPSERLEVPREFRYQEPMIVAPIRQDR